MSDLLTADEVAALYKVKRTTVWAWHRKGQLIGVKVGRGLRFERGAVEAFAKPSTPKAG